MLQQTEGTESLKFGFVSLEEKAGSKRVSYGATLLMDRKKVEE